ncbi:MAG: nucleotide exchange factor GrpE [Opitutaceae bacterium]|nr:nucleotide exchange factor GrpE [Opitutaceae bacterium]
MKAEETDKIKELNTENSSVEEVEESEEVASDQTEITEDQVPHENTEDQGEELAEVEKELTVEELLEQSRKEKEDLYQKVLRAAADFENFRKRTVREKDELRKYAISSLIEELLPALDNLDLGLSAADNHPEAKAVSDGFRMVAQQLTSILKSNGLECLDPVGDEFDPNFHESVGFQSSDEVEDHKIIQVVRKGYTLNGRILRAANVTVSSGPGDDSPGEKES